MAQRVVGLAAILLTALALVPVGAHLASLPNKIGMDAAAYLVAQQVYNGWAWWGAVIIAAIALDFAYAVQLRHERRRFWLALAAGALTAASLAVFFVWVFPANEATANWTSLPADWRQLRRNWEYGHAAEAGLTFLALTAVAAAALGARR